jgi:hypothetical protein
MLSRADFVSATTSAAILLATSSRAALAADSDTTTVTAFKLPSGLQYVELSPGSGPTPEYGQLVSIAYTSYIQLPNNQKKQQFDKVSAFLYKHGNGRCIAGLDEGIHTLQVGGTRRLLIPPKLGYVTSGLGPMPVNPWNRYQLNRLLDEMTQVYKAGTLIMDVTLLAVLDDEADQGYYSDKSLTPDEYEILKSNLQRKAAEAAAANGGKAKVIMDGDE